MPAPMSQWSDIAVARLLDDASCPSCGVDALQNRRCRNCGADLSGRIGLELWSASRDAATALRARQAVLERVPRLLAEPSGASATEPSPAATPPASAALAAPAAASPAAADPRSSATVQSVLAVAGAGLFAISAIVFTFFNPDLSDRALRSVIVGLITLLFLGGAWLLARRRLQFSAEAVGALGMLFVALDVYALSELTVSGLSPWVFTAVGTLASGSVMVALSRVARIRTWLWISLLGLSVVPSMLGYAGGTVLSAVIGHLGTAFVALALVALVRATARRFDGRLRAEQVTLTVVQVVAVAIVLAQARLIEADSTTGYWLGICAILAAIAVLAGLASRYLARGLWSFVAGAAGVAAFTGLPFALDLGAHGAEQWYFAFSAVAGAAGLIVLGALAPTPATIERQRFTGGAFGMAVVSVLATVLLALLIGAAKVLGSFSGSDLVASVIDTGGVLAVVLGLAAGAIGFGAFAAITLHRDIAQAPRANGVASLAIWLAALAGLVFVCAPGLLPWAQIAIALGLAVATSAALVLVPGIRAASLRLRLPLIVAAHLAVLLAGIISWTDDRLAAWAGIAVVTAIIALARTVPAGTRFLHVAVGYAYALVVVATALGQLGIGTIALLCLTTSIGLIGAIVATALPQVKPAAWYSILVVTSVPFVIGVIQVVFERSGWTALSTGIMFLLAMTLLVSRRPGLGIVLRAIAAGLLIPSLAVVVICLGAQVLAGSASPMTLPVIAAIVALVLPSTGVIRSALKRRGIGERDATVARIALEVSAMLTGVIAVGLALIRVAAGLPTTFLVLVILALGAAATSFWAKRRYGWWTAAACLTGALWCVWALAGIGLLEPYLLPPSLAAATIGLLLTARGAQGVPLYTSGLLVAVVPTLVVLAVSEAGETVGAASRGYGLVAASWALLGLGLLLDRGASPRAERLRTLCTPTHGVAIVAGVAGAIQGVRFGVGADMVETGAIPLVVLCLGIGLAGAVPAAAAARAILSHAAIPQTARIRWSSFGRLSARWLYAPAALYVGLATWTAIERDWFTIWLMWSLMVAYLAAMVIVAVRLRNGRTSLPPVWFIFTLAFITAIVAWSPRDLRVEWFSLPLGLFALFAGVAAMRGRQRDTADTQRGTLSSWPARWHGSWPLLAPGLGVMFLASILATFTDPQTWRAILVIAIALVAILVGSSRKLAAPFLLGIIVLPIENIFVFVVQIGRGIESVPWWITLAVVGAVLLIIAVTYERRAGDDNSIAARLGDLA